LSILGSSLDSLGEGSFFLNMYLHSIDIHGFKSFAERTRLEFDRGVTAIVGPNGCGKSNVVDAIRWVLGETSAKALRGADMSDVIFNGTQKRRAQGLAEVTLTLVDCEETLGTDFHEVAITRRVFRDAKSEYRINDTLCRLKDIHELFMDTGIGRSAYSVMEQGKIDMLLSSKPQDRRQVFEEAAGITKFKKEKKEALRKLEYTQANLLRISDVLEEQEHRIEALGAQVRKAKEFRALSTDIKVLDCHLAYHQFLDFENKVLKVKSSIEALDIRQKELHHEVPELEKRLAQYRDQARKTEDDSTQLRSRLNTLREQEHSANNAIVLNAERQRELMLRKERLAGSVSEAKKKIAEQRQLENAATALVTERKRQQTAMLKTAEKLAAQSEKIRGQQEGVVDQLAGLNVEQTEANRSLVQAEVAVEGVLAKQTYGLDESVGDLEKQLVSLEQSDADANFEKALKEVEALAKRDAGLKKAMQPLIKSLKGGLSKLGDMSHAVFAMQKVVKKAAAQVEQANQQRKTAEKNVTKYRKELANLSKKINALEAKRETLGVQADRVDDDWQQVKTDAAVAERAVEAAEDAVVPVREKLSEAEAQHKRVTGEEKEIDKRLKKLASETAKSDASLQSLAKEVRGVLEKISDNSDSRPKLLDVIRGIEDRLGELRKLSSGVEERRGKEEVALTKHELKLESVLALCVDRHAVDLRDFESDFAGFVETAEARAIRYQHKVEAKSFKQVNWSAVEKGVQQMRLKVDNMGGVNMGAIKEYEELEERHSFMKTQHDDLSGARDELLELIEKLDAETEVRFTETFSQVVKNFRSMFKLLFGEQGRADLVLLDEDDPLESGIEVIARPPGKKLQSITLLSGGERAMTAVALLFSIYQIKPSPFCVLDELDAPLDEANIGRFLKVLETFVDKSQFIIVTHHKRTMHAAQVMYGVTMEESGVSKPVGMRLVDGEAVSDDDSAASHAARKLDSE